MPTPIHKWNYHRRDHKPRRWNSREQWAMRMIQRQARTWAKRTTPQLARGRVRRELVGHQ